MVNRLLLKLSAEKFYGGMYIYMKGKDGEIAAWRLEGLVGWVF